MRVAVDGAAGCGGGASRGGAERGSKLLAHYRSSDRLLHGGDLSSDREERIKHLLSRTLKVQLGKG